MIGRAAVMSKLAPHSTVPAPADTPPLPRIAIVGYGLVTPLGDGAWPSFAALLAGRTLADRADALPPDTAPLDLARALGCIASVQHNRADPAVLLAERAIREAALMGGVALSGLPMFLGTSKGAIAKLSRMVGQGLPIDDDTARCVALGPHAYMTNELQRRLHTAPQSHHVAACSSGLFALDAARHALLHTTDNANPYALVASADAAITPAFVASYQRLGVLGTVTASGYRQRPLDERRQGFMLSEIGVAVLLKRLSPGEPLPRGSVELIDTALATEPYDMIRSPAEMPSLAKLWSRLTSDRTIDVIHPHAPGTREHDPAELGVLLRTPSSARSGHSDTYPDVYAVKGAIGHGLGASGLASLVVAAMSLRSGKIPPMPWLSESDAEPMKLPGGGRLETDPNARACKRSGTHAVLAAGFGGHLAAALLQGPQQEPASDEGLSSDKPKRA